MIGIVRHFKVTYKPENKWMTAKQFNNWVEEYDKAEIQIPIILVTIGNGMYVIVVTNLEQLERPR